MAQGEVQTHSGGNCSRYGISGLRHAGVTSRWRARGYPVSYRPKLPPQACRAAQDPVLQALRNRDPLLAAGLIGDHSSARRLFGRDPVQYFPLAASKARKLPLKSTVITSPPAVTTIPDTIGAAALYSIGPRLYRRPRR